MEDLIGDNWNDDDMGFYEDLKQGARMRYVINDKEEDDKIYSSETKENETVFKIEFKKCLWTKDENWGSRDSDDELYHFKDPSDYEDDLIFPQFAPIWLPIPFGEYLKNINLDDGYTIDARVLPIITCELERNDFDDKYPEEKIKVVATYNEKGILTSYKLYIKDHQVVIDISLESFITYNFVIFSIITAIIYISLLYVIYKIMKT
jgi:hypothetical protein